MAQNEQINAVQDTPLLVNAANGVLANDPGAALVLPQLQLLRTTGGGQIYFDTNGSYKYISAPGFSGVDTVQYTTNNAGTGTLTINVAATALVPFVSVGDQVGARHQVTHGFGQVGDGVATSNNTQIALAGGGYVVAINYLDQAFGSVVKLQTYDANHNLLGVFDPGVVGGGVRMVALPNGNYAVAYGVRAPIDPNNPNGNFTQTSSVQLFDAAGHSLTGPTPFDVPGPVDGLASLSVLPNGGFVLLQVTVDTIYAQSFSAVGVPENQPYAIGVAGESRLAGVLTNGQIVVYHSVNGNELHLQRYDVHGNAIGGEIVPAGGPENINSQAHVAQLAGGGFAVAWASNSTVPDPDPNLSDHYFVQLFTQVVDTNGNLVGSSNERDFAFTALFGAPNENIVPLANGNFVVWGRSTIVNGKETDIVQVYDAGGNPVGNPIEFTSITAFGVTRALPYALPDGGFAITFQSADPASHDLLVYDNNGTFVGKVRMHDPADGTSYSSFALVNRPNGDTLILAQSYSATDPNDPNSVSNNDITVQTIRFDGTTPEIQTGMTFDTTATLPVKVYIPDPDGSEVLTSLDVSGVPAGWTLSAAGGIATLNGGVWSVTGVGIQHSGSIDLVLTPPGPVNGSATLSVVAHTADTVNGTQNQSTPAPFTVTLQTGPVTTGTSGNDSYAASGAHRFDGLGGTDTITFGFKLVDAAFTFTGNQVVVDGPDGSHTVLTGFEVFKFTDGTVNNADGNPLVDDLFYYAHHHDAWTAHVDADLDYNTYGWTHGWDPSAFFSTATYLSLYPDVKAAGVNPLTHYDQAGWKEGRVPSIDFNPAAYLAANPDVKAAGVDPLKHFLESGAQEGRQPIAFTHLLAPNGFDYVYYLHNNPDVAAANVDPFQHFETTGWKEGRNPNALFDTKGYLANYADVKNAGVNPLDHFSQSGWHEGRDPSVYFDTSSYLGNYPDIAAAHVNPLNHFLVFGLTEGRSAFADYLWG